MNKQVKLDAFVKENLSKDMEESRKGIRGSYDLPNGWKWVRLDVVAWLNKEKRDPRKEMPNEEFLYIDISSIEEGAGRILEVKKILGKNAPSRARRVIHANDVIMSTVRPYLKSIAIIPEEYDNQICSTGFAVLTCKKEILPKYLFYLLFSDVVIRQCNEMMVGAHYPALRFDQVARIKIPLPPLEEQKRIVSRLEQLISRAEEAKRLRKLAIEEAGKIMQAALNKVFSKADEEGWERVKIEKIVSLQKGRKPSKLFNEKIEGSVPYLTAQYMRGLEEPKYCLKTDDIILTEEKDVLIIMDGSYSGDTFIGFNGALASTMAKFLFNKSIILPEYLYYFLRNNFEILNTKTKGAAIPHVRKDVLFNLQVPLPPLEEQKRIIVYLDKLRETIESIRRLQQITEEKLEKLVPSILDKAFRGEL
jgi:type I restriction enzyme S subunit